MAESSNSAAARASHCSTVMFADGSCSTPMKALGCRKCPTRWALTLNLARCFHGCLFGIRRKLRANSGLSPHVTTEVLPILHGRCLGARRPASHFPQVTRRWIFLFRSNVAFGVRCRKSHSEQIWSALPPIADIDLSSEDFSVGPKGDIAAWPDIKKRPPTKTASEYRVPDANCG